MNTLADKALLVTIRAGTLLVLFTPLVVTQSTLFPYVVGKATYARALIEILLASWVVLALRQPAYRSFPSWVLWLFGVYLVTSLAAAVAGVSFQRSFWGDYRRMGGVFDLVHWLAFAVVVAAVFKERGQWRWLLNANLGVSLLVALLGLAQHYQVPVFDPIFWYLRPTGRVDITFGNPTYVGAYTLVNLFLALAFLASSFQAPVPAATARSRGRRDRPRRRAQAQQPSTPILLRRGFWAVTAALDLWVLTLSGTRGAVVGLMVGLLVVGAGYLAWGGRRRLRLLVAALMALPFLLAVLVPLARETAFFQALARSNVTVNRFNVFLENGLADPSVAARLSAAQAGLAAFRDAPVLGWGPENFAVAFDQHAEAQDAPGMRLADQAHNKPVEELVTKGIIGFAAYVFLLGRMAWVLVRLVRREPEERLFSLFVGAAAVAYVVQTLFLFDTPGTFLQFVLLLAWVAIREGQLAPRQDAAPVANKAVPVSRRMRGPQPQRRALTNASSSLSFRWTFAGLMLLLVAASLYLFVYQPYRAAQLLPIKAEGVTQFFEAAQRSFRTFPPLATLGRQVLLDTLAENWNRVPREQEANLLQGVRAEGEAALRSEPRNGRLHLGLASVYQHATDRSYLPLGRRHLEAAQELAPHLFETFTAAIQQEVAEGNYAQALTMIYEYGRNNEARQLALKDLMNGTQRLLGGQIGREEYLCRWAGKEHLTLEERARLVCDKKPTS